jgi:hypothetical protein
MAANIFDPANVVVPWSAIVDHLQGKLTGAEINALLFAILSRRKTEVRPGELITAEIFNQVLAELTAIDVRLARLESAQPVTGTSVVIDRIIPSGNLTVGQEIAIEGKNFDFSIGGSYVTFGKKSVFVFKPGSRDDRLITDVPDLGPLPPEGERVPLTVSNRSSSDFRMVTVLSAEVILSGNVLVVPGTVEPNPPQAGVDTLFPYTITSAASKDANFSLQVLLGGAGEQPDGTKYDHLVAILDKDKQPRSRTLRLAPNTSELIYVKVRQLPFTSDFSIVVVASAPGVKGDSGVKSYTVGTQDPNDDVLVLETPVYTPSTAVSGGNAQLKLNGTVKATLTLKIADTASITSATVDVSLTLKSGTGWTVVLLDPTPDSGGTTGATGVQITKQAPRTIEFAVQAKPNPSASGAVELTITRTGQTGTPKTKTLGLGLQLIP